MASLKHFLANQWDRTRAEKRGDGRAVLSIDFGTAEERYRAEPSHDLTPDKIFERRWALVLLENVLARLHDESAQAGKTDSFNRLKGFLTGEQPAVAYSQLAGELNTSEGAVKVNPFFLVSLFSLRSLYPVFLLSDIDRAAADVPLLRQMGRRNSVFLVVAALVPLLGIAALMADSLINDDVLAAGAEKAMVTFSAVSLLGLPCLFWISHLIRADLATLAGIISSDE